FTRAFRDEFDLTPEALRRQGHLDGVRLLEPLKMEEANGCRSQGKSSPMRLISNATARSATLERGAVDSSSGCRSKPELVRSLVMKASIDPQTDALQSLADVSASIRQRRISPVDVVTACLDRIERLQ